MKEIAIPALIEEWILNLDTSALKTIIDSN